MMDWMIVYK